MRCVGQTADGTAIYGPVVSTLADRYQFFVDADTAWFLTTLVDLVERGDIDLKTAQIAEASELIRFCDREGDA